jgi:two-component system, NarL family, response regulator LiaR
VSYSIIYYNITSIKTGTLFGHLEYTVEYLLKYDSFILYVKIPHMNDEVSRNSPAPGKVRIIVADDHPLMREALTVHLQKQPDFEILAAVSDGEAAVRLSKDLKPDVVILDISMPKMNGIEATRQIKAHNADIAILVLTVHNDYERILGVLAAGASGYLTKSATGEEIVQAVRGVASGETVLSTPVSQELIKYSLRNATQPLPVSPVEKLSNREVEILRLAAKGLGNKDIALKVNLSIPTVKSYFADIFSKLKVNSRTEAVIAGLRLGFINLQDIE